ncbi:hypothetical protein INT45_013219 [Circinella minor]|uniref:Uncharacterized protein n=1 Tax=Circinella minor TaxID=1195481 RepID=A0A8H7VGE7_9FUNG|nr:hypothetical protein INT45_013219 [Circinella minor]
MASYWYSTDGMDHKRLSSRHLEILDRAYERRTRVEISDDQAFGNMAAIADPFLGTMTAGDIHYGLYRNPSLRKSESNCSLNTLILVDSTTAILPPSPNALLQQQASRSRYNNNTSSSNNNNLSNNDIVLPEDINDYVLHASDHNIRRPSQQHRNIQLPSTTGTTAITNRRMVEEEECVCCVIS